MSAEKIIGHINSTESFGSVDGPGVRFIFFLQGCPMRCKYCHNPDTWAGKAYEEKTTEEVFKHAFKYKNYWGSKGGITVSGGEALLQIDFVTELFSLARSKGINTALDTSGSTYEETPEFIICTTDTSGFWYCIPYNDDTKHLVGTEEEAPEYYRYWEN